MRDIRYALRSLSRSKGFVAVAVLSLALALGLNTTVYSVVDSFTHPWVPFRDPERLVKVGFGPTSSPDEYRLIQDAPFAGEVGAWTLAGQGLTTTGSVVERTYLARATPNFFTLLGVTPERGRLVQPDDPPGTVVISHSLWTRLLGRRADLDRVPLVLEGQPFTVVGVMPPEMAYPEDVGIWQIMPATPEIRVYPVVRLKPDVTIAEAQEYMLTLARGLASRSNNPRLVSRTHVQTIVPNRFQLQNFHLALAGCATLVLLIACANLANLMLARGIARRAELALRLAIGASRKALVKQLVTEATLVAAAGGALGMIFASWGIHAVMGQSSLMDYLPLQPLHFSWRVAAFGLLATGFTVVLFGLLPAIRASDVDLAEPIKESAGTTTGRHRDRYSVLAIVQVALALILLVAGTVLSKSAYNYARQAVGIDTQGMFTASIGFRDQKLTGDAVGRRFAVVNDRILKVKGVTSTASSLRRHTPGQMVISDDERSDSIARVRVLGYNAVSPGYLATAGLELAEGRDFQPGDRDVAVINDGLAARLWRRVSPVGRMISLGRPNTPGRWIRVIGVIRSGPPKAGDPDLAPPPDLYLPLEDTASGRTLLIRTDLSNPRIMIDLAQEIQAAAALPRAPRVTPTDQWFVLSLRVQLLTSRIFVFISLCALGLACVGLYGVLVHTVSVRVREFAVRMALGATEKQIFRMVLHDGGVIFLAGTALGAFGALATAPFISRMLRDVSYTDAWALAISELVLCTAALLACLAPARRATKSDPVEILRAT